jgi:hypothetical protein
VSKETRSLSAADAWHRTDALDAIDSPELLTLKAHALMDGALSRILAGRLGIAVDRLANLSFAHVAELSAAAEQHIQHLRPAICRLDEARNEIAHQWEAATLRTHMQRLTKELGVGPWPTAPKEQIAFFRVALKRLLAAANSIAQLAAMSAQDWQVLNSDLKRRANNAIRATTARRTKERRTTTR